MSAMAGLTRRIEDEAPLMDAETLAAFLDLTKRSVWRKSDAGELPRPVRIGHTVRWRRDEIEAWVAAGCPSRDKWEAIRAGK